MKKKLMLILLLSPLIAEAQNSTMDLNPTLLASNDPGTLTAIEGSNTENSMLTWPDETDPHGSNENEEFESLLLAKQLTELDQSTPFRVMHHPTLERYIRVFLKDQRPRLERVLAKSAYYFPLIEKQLDQNDLPIELKYLAVVESALNPEAVSHSGARGMWQFMYGTGKEYGLFIDSYVDQRYDHMRSTEAACQYLKRLYKMFGNWDLALAAYNSGPGNVRKAIRRAGGQKDYWAIRKYLPPETRGYLPSFYATMYLFEFGDFHKLKPASTEMKLMRTDTVNIKKPLSLDLVSRGLQIDPELIQKLNPQYKKQWIPFPGSKRLTLTLPEPKVNEFIAMEEELYRLTGHASGAGKTLSFIPIDSRNSYVVKNGDNLSSIARMHKVSVVQLKTWNGMETNYLIAGQRLVVTDRIAKDQLKQRGQTKQGDQVKQAAQLKQVAQMKQVAQKKRSDSPDKTTVKKAASGKAGIYETYTVRSGDTLFRISKMFENVSIAEIRAWNGLDGINHLQPGMVLKIIRTQ